MSQTAQIHLVCDVCKTEVNSLNQPPVGWIKLTAQVTESAQQHWDVCGAKCLAKLAAVMENPPPKTRCCDG